MSIPSVSVILAVLDERAFIDDCLGSLRTQTYAGPVDVIVSDGGSTDGTLERVLEWQRDWQQLEVISNPDRLQSRGLWLAAVRSVADLLVRADAHTTYSPDYIERSVSALTMSDAVAVGGPLRPASSTPFGQAVVVAMTNPIGIGPAPFHRGQSAGHADTVYLGTFRREDFIEIGGMRTLPSGVAEDADLYYRWRMLGRVVLLDPAIRSSYRPRETPKRLWTQFYRYGVGKADMWMVNGELPSLRPLAPLSLVLGLAVGVALIPISSLPLLGLAAVWLATLFVALRFRVRAVFAATIMHLSYGFGLLRGLARRPSAVRRSGMRNGLGDKTVDET